MSKVTRCSNNNMRHYVNEREEFSNNNDTVNAYDTMSTTGTDLYVVFSYGNHFPMYIAEEFEGKVNWYGNEDRYSNTTTSHQSKCRPDDDIMWFDTDTMMGLAQHGITGLAGGMV